MNAVTVMAPAIVAVIGFPEYRQEAVALGFGLMAISRVFSSSAEKLGKSLSVSGPRNGFVYDLLENHLTCEGSLVQAGAPRPDFKE